jgi:hypothetical protein
MGWKRSILTTALKIPAIREEAVRELAASLRVIADVGAPLHQDPSGNELIRRNPLLRKPLEQIGNELIQENFAEIKSGFGLLRPQAATGIKKIRVGGPNDGGYVMLDDFQGIDTALSLGIDKDVSWDVDVAKKGIIVYQFDHTIDGPPVTDNPHLVFAQKRISTVTGPGAETLPSLLKRFDKGSKPNIVLKIDIECDEWGIFDQLSSEVVSRFSQIVGEFHFFEAYSADPRCRRLFTRVLKKLTDNYAIVHIHANSWGDFHTFNNVAFPNVLELTFANRCLYSFSETGEKFPGIFDAPNDPRRPDAYLNTLWS